MDGYFSGLDSVLNSYENRKGFGTGDILYEKTNMYLYSIFYNISLSHNQIIDLLTVRSSFSDVKELLNLNCNFFLDPAVVGHDKPFTKQLIKVLRRVGNDSFYFSSVSDADRKSKEWGQEFLSNIDEVNDEDLIKIASQGRYYPKVVEWVRELDGISQQLYINKFSYYENYNSIFKTFADYALRDNVELKNKIISRNIDNRSVILWDDDYFTQEETEIRRNFANFLSIILYSKTTNSTLILDGKINCNYNPDEEQKKQSKYVEINCKKLIEEYGFIPIDINDADKNEIALVLNESKKIADKGWQIIDSDEPKAKEYFEKALKNFLKKVCHKDFSLFVNFSISPISGFSLDCSLSPEYVIDQRNRRFFKGVHKFVNIKDASDFSKK